MTIREIAEMAGVSNAAVSRYLNNGYLSDEKREKIKKVIEETGYSPSHNARTLRTKRTKLIGVALPKIDSETISKIVAGISMELSKYGYYLILANTDNTVKKEYEYIRVFKNNLVDGMIIIGTMMDKTHKKLIKSLDCPAVVVGQQVDYCQCVYHDDFEAARQLTELMIEAGRRNIGYIGVPKADVAAGLRRFEGYSAALKKHGLKPPEGGVLEGAFTSESGYLSASKLLKARPETDGIFCATDNIALGVYEYLEQKGRKIGDDISVVGTGHTRLSTIVRPKLTTVHFQYKTSGIEAAKMLLGELESDSPTSRRHVEIKLEVQLIKHDSV